LGSSGPRGEGDPGRQEIQEFRDAFFAPLADETGQPLCGEDRPEPGATATRGQVFQPGQVGQVAALVEPEDRAAFTVRLKRHCAAVLKRHQVPVKVEIAEGPQHTDRFKKVRIP